MASTFTPVDFSKMTPVSGNATVAPHPQTQSPGLLGKIGNGISNYFSNIGKDVSGANAEATQNYQDYVNKVDKSNPSFGDVLSEGGNLAKNITSAAVSPIAELPGFKQLGQGFNTVGQKIVNTSAGNAVTDTLANNFSPQTLGTASDLLQTGLNVATLQGASKVKEQVSNVWDKVYNKTPTAPADIVSARTADATPSYDTSMEGTKVKNSSGEVVPRTNEGVGLRGQRTVNTSAAETEQGQQLANISDYPDKGTALEKYQSVDKAIGTEAESMRGGLQAEDKTTPLDANAEKTKVNDLVRSNLPPEIQEKLGVLTPEDQTMLKGMQEKIGAPQPKGGFDLSLPGESKFMPKTAANRYYEKVLDAVNEYNGTREGKLDLRQKIEKAYQSEGGKYTYGSDSHNALAETNTDLRNALNKDLADTTKNTDTQASLKKQTNLYRAKDTLVTKARGEAASTLGRIYQEHPLLHRIITRGGMRILIDLAGIGVVTTWINKVEKGL